MSASSPAWKRLADHLMRIERRRSMTQTPETPEETEYEEPARRRRPLLSAEAALAKTAFEAATTPEMRERLKRGKALVVVVSVPSASWVSPISTHIASLTDAKRIARDGSQRTKDLPGEGNDQVLAALAEGRSVVGVSQAPNRYLPSVLVSSADVAIRVVHPDGAVIVRAIRNCLRGRVSKNFPQGLAVGLDFVEIAAALRPGSKPAEAIQRLQATVKGRSAGEVTKVALPTLEEAVFYGEAREWGLALAADVAEAKQTGDWSGVDRGAVFYGEPGTGKTWLARLIAAACKVPIVETSVADLFGSSAGYLDSVIKAQRAVFAKAAALAPCILFWDELEAMPNRATLSPRGRDWWLPVVDDFLLLVSSVPPGIVMLGATNHLDLVDAALLRPGRMERSIEIKPPARAEGLAMILRFHLGTDLADEDLLALANMGLGATAAVAMEWVRRARRIARTAKRKMNLDDLAAVIAPPDTRPPEVQRQTAIHEAAHAVITIALGAEELQSVSIVRDDRSGGRTNVRSASSLGRYGRGHFEKIAIGMLAGRAAEILFFGGATAGAGGHPNSDLAIVTRIVAALHASLGLADSLIYRGEPGSLHEALIYDPNLRASVEDDMRKLHARADELVRLHKKEIEAVAEALLLRRHLSANEVKKIVSRTKEQAVTGAAHVAEGSPRRARGSEWGAE